LVAAAAALRVAGGWLYVTPLDHLSLLMTTIGLVFLLGGRGWFARSWPALALLVFVIPVPATLGGSEVVSGLQTVATRASTFLLQAVGVAAYREGNVIVLREAELGIVEACCGLRMLMVFCALSVVTAALIPTGWIRKALLVTSALPLAILCNVIRITTAGVASISMGTATGHFIFHDLAGWLMVPLAFLFLGAEVFILSKLFRPIDDTVPRQRRATAL
jgi:exosortase